MINPADKIINIFGKKKGMFVNHLIHFIEGCLRYFLKHYSRTIIITLVRMPLQC